MTSLPVQILLYRKSSQEQRNIPLLQQYKIQMFVKFTQKLNELRQCVQTSSFFFFFLDTLLFFFSIVAREYICAVGKTWTFKKVIISVGSLIVLDNKTKRKYIIEGRMFNRKECKQNIE